MCSQFCTLQYAITGLLQRYRLTSQWISFFVLSVTNRSLFMRFLQWLRCWGVQYSIVAAQLSTQTRLKRAPSSLHFIFCGSQSVARIASHCMMIKFNTADTDTSFKVFSLHETQSISFSSVNIISPFSSFSLYSIFPLLLYFFPLASSGALNQQVFQHQKLNERLLFSLFHYSVVSITMRRWWRSCWTEEPASTLRTMSCGRRCTPPLHVATRDWSRSSLHSKTCRYTTPGFLQWTCLN